MTGTLGDGSLPPVEAALDRLRERHGDVRVETETVENDPDYFEHGEALAAEGYLAGAGAWVEDGEPSRAASGRVLFIRHPESPETWGLPGGGVESGESLAETAVREVREETGVEVRITGAWKARHRTIVHRDDAARRLHMLDVWFEAVPADEAGETAPSAADDEEVLEARWFEEPPGEVHDPFEERVAEWADG